MSNLLYTDLYYVMCQMGPIWPSIQKKRIFLTGGTGFVGTWMTETFAACNKAMDLKAEMVVLTRKDVVSTDPAIKFVHGDIRDFEYPEGKFDYIIHAAADYTASPTETLDISYNGTKRVLDFAKKCEAERVVFTSSGAIYKANPVDYKTAYGEGKRVAEMLCAIAYEEKVNTYIARLFGFVGPCLPLDRNFAICKFIKEGLAGGPVKVKGGKNVIRSYLYASDMATALWMMVLWDKANHLYNVGSSDAISIAELAKLVAEVCEVELVQEEGEYPDDTYLPPPGPKVNIGLREAIERTVVWHKEQQK